MMKLANIRSTILVVVFVVAGVFATQTQTRSLPTFEVDRTWPKVPSQWKLGDASSIAIDAKDNVWVLHRPRTLKPEQAAMAAPASVCAGDGYEWPEREHGIHIDNKG